MISKSYTFDISEFRDEYPTGQADCTAQEQGDEWVCDISLDLDTTGLSVKEVRTIRTSLRARFEEDLRDQYGHSIKIYWTGDKRAQLLRLQKGDKVRFKGGEGEVVYVIPDKCGVKTTDGRILNFDFKSLDHFLFKKL